MMITPPPQQREKIETIARYLVRSIHNIILYIQRASLPVEVFAVACNNLDFFVSNSRRVVCASLSRIENRVSHSH